MRLTVICLQDDDAPFDDSDAFAAVNGGTAATADPFGGSQHDPFAPTHNNQVQVLAIYFFSLLDSSLFFSFLLF